jgi:hypothetical protein
MSIFPEFLYRGTVGLVPERVCVKAGIHPPPAEWPGLSRPSEEALALVFAAPSTKTTPAEVKSDDRLGAKRLHRPLRGSRRITDKQTRAIEVVAECQGNFCQAANKLGVTPKTVRQHYFAGIAKIGGQANAHLQELRRQHKAEKAKTICEEMEHGVAADDEGDLPSARGHGRGIRKDRRN